MRASPRVVETIVERCAGNPLAVVEIARAAGPDLLVPDDAAAPALPPGSALERTWSAAIDALPEASRTALAVLAHSRTPCRVQLEPVFRDLGIGGEDLAPAERRRLVQRDGEEVSLRHGLLRPVIAARTSQALRRRVLDGLARHAPPDLAVWYLAEAGEPPDDELAGRARGGRPRGPAARRPARRRPDLGARARTSPPTRGCAPSACSPPPPTRRCREAGRRRSAGASGRWPSGATSSSPPTSRSSAPGR